MTYKLIKHIIVTIFNSCITSYKACS